MRTFFFLGMAALTLAVTACGSTVTGTGGTGGSDTNGVCPATEPVGAVSCAGHADAASCTYGDSVRPDCRHQYLCVNKGWAPNKTTCTEPASCPAAEPMNGTVCNGSEGDVCTYGNDLCLCSACAGGPCMQEAVWSCAKPPTTAGCPPVIPNDGTACDTVGLACDYGFPCGGSGAHVTCFGSSAGDAWKWDTGVNCPL